jgi:signal peptidase I
VSSEQKHADAREAKKAKSKESSGGALKTIFYAILIALVVRTFLFEPFNIPSGSMLPGLRIGDYLFVSKYSYGYSRYSFPFSPNLFSGRIPNGHPSRGDVVVFRKPTDTKIDFIKRVIGLPGDRVKVEGGQLYINGNRIKRVGPLKRPDVDGSVHLGHDRKIGRECTNPVSGVDQPAKLYRQVLPSGRSFLIWECSDNEPESDNTRTYVVPAGHYFMMGDNRDNSRDSRFPGVGPVPAENLIGKAQFLFLSVNGTARIWEVWKWPGAIRWDRIFKGIR